MEGASKLESLEIERQRTYSRDTAILPLAWSCSHFAPQLNTKKRAESARKVPNFSWSFSERPQCHTSQQVTGSGRLPCFSVHQCRKPSFTWKASNLMNTSRTSMPCLFGHDTRGRLCGMLPHLVPTGLARNPHTPKMLHGNPEVQFKRGSVPICSCFS